MYILQVKWCKSNNYMLDGSSSKIIITQCTYIEGLHGDVTDRVINAPAIFGGKIR